MAKQLTVYKNGMGRDGERHLTEAETSLELYKISFKLGENSYVIWPDDLRVSIGGDQHGQRLDKIILDLVAAKTRQDQQIAGLRKQIQEMRGAK